MSPKPPTPAIDGLRKIADVLWRFHNDRLADPALNEMKPYIEALNKFYAEEMLRLVGGDEKGELVEIPCPDGDKGCWVTHEELRMTPEVRARNKLRAQFREAITKKWLGSGDGL